MTSSPLTQERLTEVLRAGGVEAARLEAQWIFEKYATTPEKIPALLERRLKGEPLAYLLGEKGFYKDIFEVCPGVLIPRPETELLVEKGLEFLKTTKAAQPKIFDFGCGSGCLGLSLLREMPQAVLTGFDVSAVAVEVSRRNARRLQLSQRASFVQKSIQDLEFQESADLIVANPPYIAPTDPQVEPHVAAYEPHLALYAEENGFHEIRVWSEQAFRLLKANGMFVMEFGFGQEHQVDEILQSFGFRPILFYKDLAGVVRAVSAQKGE